MAIVGAHELVFTPESAALWAKGMEVMGEPTDQGYGVTVMLNLPGGLEVLLYEPRHPVAIDIAGR